MVSDVNLHPYTKMQLRDEATGAVAATLNVRHTWQAATRNDRAKAHRERKSGIIVAVKERCYVMKPDCIVDIDPIIGRNKAVVYPSG